MSTPPRSISGSREAPVATLTWSDALGKRVRRGDWADQAISTTRKVHEAVDAGQWEVAAQLVDYFMEEAKVCHVIYTVWSEGFERFLLGRGVTDGELAAERVRLAHLLHFPDGEDFAPHPRWRRLGELAGGLGNDLRGFEVDAAAAHERFEELRERWRQLHDRWADYQSGLLTFAADRFGEAAVGQCFAEVLEPYLGERYAPFDTRVQPYEDTLERNLYLAFEAMRAHLCGPERTGEVGLEEHDDRWVISFDPCGSGGRGQRGDDIEGTPSRSDPPYGFAVTTEPHDWAGNEVGVCLYCAHCVVALQKWPMEQWGAPVRVVDPPLHPAETVESRKQCQWTVYKTVEAVPEEAYRRVGAVKPGS